MVRSRSVIALLLLAALGAQASGGQGALSAHASVDSTSYLVGDWITVKVDLHYPKGATVRGVLADSVGGFLILSGAPLVATSETTGTTSFVIAKYDSGDATFPPVDFAATIPGDTALRTVSTNPIALTVRTVAVDTSLDIRDLKPPLAIPMSLAEILMWVGGVLLALALMYGAYRYWKARKARKALAQDAYTAPARPAHVIALEQLALLKEKRLWQQGRIKEYYSEATEIFRRYLENRYSMAAMEETTDEILSGLRKLRFPEAMLDAAERILQRADLVKFAKFEPALVDHEELLRVIYDFVDRTKIVHMSAPVHPGAKEPVDAGA